MTPLRSEARDALVNAMANASLFEVIQQARKVRDTAVMTANEYHDAAVRQADMAFISTVIGAAIELDGFIITGDPDVVAVPDSSDTDTDDED